MAVNFEDNKDKTTPGLLKGVEFDANGNQTKVLDGEEIRRSIQIGSVSGNTLTATSAKIIEGAREHLDKWRNANSVLVKKAKIMDFVVFDDSNFEVPMLTLLAEADDKVHVVTLQLYLNTLENNGRKPSLEDSSSNFNGQTKFFPAYPSELYDNSFATTLAELLSEEFASRKELNSLASKKVLDYGMIVYDDDESLGYLNTALDYAWSGLVDGFNPRVPVLTATNLKNVNAKISITPGLDPKGKYINTMGDGVACDFTSTIKTMDPNSPRRRNGDRHGVNSEVVIAKSTGIVDLIYAPKAQQSPYQYGQQVQTSPYDPAFTPHIVITSNETLSKNRQNIQENLLTQLYGLCAPAPFITKNNWLNVFMPTHHSKGKDNLGVVGLLHLANNLGMTKGFEIQLIDALKQSGTKVNVNEFLNSYITQAIVVSMDILEAGPQYMVQRDFVNAATKNSNVRDTATRNILNMMDAITEGRFTKMHNGPLFYETGSEVCAAIPAGRYVDAAGRKHDTREVTLLDVIRHYQGNAAQVAAYTTVTQPGQNSPEAMEAYKTLITNLLGVDIEWYGVYRRITWNNEALLNLFRCLVDVWQGSFFNTEGNYFFEPAINQGNYFDTTKFGQIDVPIHYQNSVGQLQTDYFNPMNQQVHYH